MKGCKISQTQYRTKSPVTPIEEDHAMATLKRELQLVAERTICGLTLAEDRINGVLAAQPTIPFIRFCIEENILTRKQLERMLCVRLRSLGRDMLAQHNATSTPPDHLVSPHALAYAIQAGEFDTETLELIAFDHGDTAETFVKTFGNNLPERIMEQLCPQ